MQCEGFSHKCDSQDAVRYRMRTAYVDEERNYMILCPFCQKESDDYWQEQWDDLERDIMAGIRDSLNNRR